MMERQVTHMRVDLSYIFLLAETIILSTLSHGLQDGPLINGFFMLACRSPPFPSLQFIPALFHVTSLLFHSCFNVSETAHQ